MGMILLLKISNALLRKKGVKQSAVAERAGFTPQEFSNILNHRRKFLRAESVIPIADALEVDVNALFGIADKEVV